MLPDNLSDPFRDGELSARLAEGIRAAVQRPLRLMEVCGTHTMAIFRHGIRTLLPDAVELISGPGCPVCVTSAGDIDQIIELASMPGVILTTCSVTQGLEPINARFGTNFAAFFGPF